MRRLMQLGLALLAVLALGGALASVASAESAGILLLPSPEGGGSVAGLTFTIKVEGESSWETLAGIKVACNVASGSGEATSDDQGTLTVKFEGCTSTLGVKCTGLSDTSGNITIPAKYDLRYLLSAPNSGVHLVVLLEHVHFSCALVLELALGCFASDDLEKTGGGKLEGELVKAFRADFLQEHGTSVIREVDNLAATEMEPCIFKVMKGAEADQEGGLSMKWTIEKATKEGTEVEVLLMHHTPEPAGIMLLPDGNEGAAKTTFDLESAAGEKTTLETSSKEKIECASVSGAGQATSDSSGTITFNFAGCEVPTVKAKCTGLANENAGEITVTGEYRFRYLLPAESSGVQLVILINHTHFSCSIALYLELGCFASMDVERSRGGGKLEDELVKRIYASFLQAAGKQEPGEIDNGTGSTMEACGVKLMKGAEAEVEAGVSTAFTTERFEKEGKEVEVLLMH